MRILIVDDHEVVRRGIRAVLEIEPSFTLCGEAVDGSDAIEKAKALRPDVVVMDISMPNINGVEATLQIKRFVPDTEIVIVSQHDTPEMVRQAFNAGAKGYVVKSAVAEDLRTAVTTVFRKGVFLQAGELSDSRRNFDSHEILQRSATFERALRESEERFRSAMNNMAEGLYTVDTQGLVTYLNPAAEKMFGWSAAELIGKKMHDITHNLHPDGSPFPAEECPGLQVLTSNVVLREHEDVFIRKNGSFFPVVVSASPLKSGDQIIGLVVCFRDDSHRRQAEEALRQSEKIYRAIGESIDFGIWICDASGRNLYSSPSFLRLVGLTQAECSDFSWVHVLHPDDAPATIAAWESCIRAQTLWEREVRFLRTDGHYHHVLVRGGPIRNTRGDVLYWAGITLDIQDRHEAEIVLRKSAGELAQHARLLDLSVNAVIVLDLQGRISYWNKGAEDLYGWTREEVSGNSIHSLLRTEYPGGIENIYDSVRRDGQWQGELVHIRKDGRQITVLSRWSLTRDLESNTESIVEVNIDVSQTKEARHELQQLVQTLESRVSDRTRDLEKLTARLRELSVRLLRTQDQERRRIARELHDGVGQLLAALNMNLSKLKREKDSLSSIAVAALEESFVLVDHASQGIRTMSHLLHPPLLDEVGLESALRWYVEGFADRSKIKVCLQLADGFSKNLPRDLSLALFRVVQECLTNVHRHSGSLSALVSIRRTAESLTLEVKDEGKGISPELHSRISSGESSGMGLRGMRERIHQFGGRLDIYPQLQGTAVIAVLPISNAIDESTDVDIESPDPLNKQPAMGGGETSEQHSPGT